MSALPRVKLVDGSLEDLQAKSSHTILNLFLLMRHEA